jgi:hypothetical protein
MLTKFSEILDHGKETIEALGGDADRTLRAAKLVHQRLENEIIRVAARLQIEEHGVLHPTSKEELLKI